MRNEAARVELGIHRHRTGRDVTDLKWQHRVQQMGELRLPNTKIDGGGDQWRGVEGPSM